ncbi:hypothetical protein Dimus_014563 [Dionaea muscipula]
MASVEHPRRIIRNFIPLQLCKELEFIHKSNCTVGYRPAVFSTTLSHLIATNCPHLIMPFVPLRERLREKVEEVFGCELELVIEFTGLISWSKGASIGWHSDDNRPYLKQRDFSVVCYLNNFGENFHGGAFHFQQGEPTTVLPMAGDVLMYTADSRNIHCVDEITDGERLTLALWFSRNVSHDEDDKLLSLFSQCTSLHLNSEALLHIPFPASRNMYWFSADNFSDDHGCHICYARLLLLGFDLYCSEGKKSGFLELNSSCDASDLLMQPLQLVRGNELFVVEFANILHALQVVQFYFWKQLELESSEVEMKPRDVDVVVPLSQPQRARVDELKHLLVRDKQLAHAEASFSYSSTCDVKKQLSFDWVSFSGTIAAWEVYTCKLHQQMVLSSHHWKSHRSIFVAINTP